MSSAPPMYLPDLWKPRKTLRDWGKTEYKIIRNWTPRDNSKPPDNTSPSSEQDNSSHHGDTGQRAPFEDPQSSHQISLLGDTTDNTPSIHSHGQDDLHTSSSEFQSIRTRSRSKLDHSQQSQPSTSRTKHSIGKAKHMSRLTDRQSDSESPSNTSGNESSNLDNQEHAIESDQDNQGSELDVDDNDPHTIDEKVSPPKYVSKVKGKANQKKTKSSLRSREGSLKTKLWHPKTIRRTKRDFNALDVCLSAYEEAIRTAVEHCPDGRVQPSLISHWKHTRKQMLSMIRNVQMTSMLEKLQRKERLKERQLQREMTSTLTDLRRAQGRYNEALSIAKQAQIQEQKRRIDEEFAQVTSSLRAIWQGQ